ncbi:peptidoglycan-recognition protein SC2-like isoform X2 [Neodiprion virginianus]|uniref:peptidoglycan-recognition protein SC2-like isoform X2 n=1 Tax=Neodiprion virginianus TaxID=2961670 RepID=UPI001EE751B7|nr:peptidoglycan-recognition protein SC2-like isoform X2 [Neodiprion virginianus]XP_046608519.1 peptidoglycan-recognition protein SC2-like isoform X2 [Neodiprion virginianus]
MGYELRRDNPATDADTSKVLSTQRRVILLTWQILAFILGLFLIAAVITILALLHSCCSSPSYDYPESLISSMDGDDLPSNLPLTPVNTTFSDSLTNISGLPINNLRFVTRNEWGAQPPTEPLGKLKHPVPYVIISHTATEFCDTQSTCTFRIRFTQVFHMESRNWSDIAYNFLIGGDAYAYIGRGWDHVGAHAYGYNSRSIGISFIGTYNTVAPSDHQMNALQQLIEIGVKSGKIAADYKLLGHRQVSKTPSPGDALYNIITTWPHWSPTP